MNHALEVFKKIAPPALAALAEAGQRDVQEAARAADTTFQQRRADARARFERRRAAP
ncbi:hypothetical protein ACMT4L_17045 [Deinococcus sp. A31D244]|uniref:hypothetical protein n=1 Tax=Deinococcus sp. A31D244 TaxID=3397675 RepID=UPI0039E172AC